MVKACDLTALNQFLCFYIEKTTRVFWSHTIEGERISFGDTPFTVAAIHMLRTLPVQKPLLQRTLCKIL